MLAVLPSRTAEASHRNVPSAANVYTADVPSDSSAFHESAVSASVRFSGAPAAQAHSAKRSTLQKRRVTFFIISPFACRRLCRRFFVFFLEIYLNLLEKYRYVNKNKNFLFENIPNFSVLRNMFVFYKSRFSFSCCKGIGYVKIVLSYTYGGGAGFEAFRWIPAV